MDILNEIIANKRKEVEERKSLYPVKLLEKSIYFESASVSLKKYLQREDKVGIIAEFKRKSPSKGVINAHAPVERTSIGYMQAGASALSILTDQKYFGGKNEDLTTARNFNYCPILRKDFFIDEYQIIEAKSIGADVILLLANVLSKEEIKSFTALAHQLQMEVLLELRDESEVSSISPDIDVVGVNNRNLRDFKVDINHSIKMAALIPDEFIKVSESGIDSPAAIHQLKTYGYKGFLIGEAFMKNGYPEIACKNLITQIKQYNPETVAAE